LPADSREAAVTGEIISRIDALNALIQDLLLFARPPHPKPTLVDVSSLVATTADLLVSDAALSGIDIQVEGASPPVVADPELLKIVFQNLIVNSGQAMRGSGSIRVSVGTTSNVCEIRFADAGPGIPPDVRQKIFSPFFTTKARGTGLGLSTAKRLVEAHHGTIQIECPPAGGTTVTIQLPVEREAALGISTRANPDKTSANPDK